MSGRTVRALPVTGADGTTLLGPLREALSGAGPALAPHPAQRAPDPAATEPLSEGEDDPGDPVAAVVSTTGSTGRAKHVLLPASALLASAAATHDVLGGSGTWLLPVPAHTVAGVQVLVRSLVAGTRPEVLDLGGGFGTEAFVTAAGALAARCPGRRYTSLVPAQLDMLLEDQQPDDGQRRAVAALRGFDAVLVGGAALPEALRGRATEAGVRVISTYGMTETCGGCVYDGVPLPGVQVRVEQHVAGAPGRVLLGGQVVARGYRGRAGGADGKPDAAGEGVAGAGPPPEGFAVESGVRWFRTADLGVLDGDTLRPAGRVDDVVVSGGVNVALEAVDRVLRAHPGVRDCLVVAVPSPRWGAQVGALVVADGRGPAPDDEVRDAVRAALGGAAVPRLLRHVERLPLTGVGKPDRVAAAAWLAPPSPGEPLLGDHGAGAAPTEEMT